MHAGLYYAPGSLKARLCVHGGSLLREFCQQHGIRLLELGKLVVASSDDERTGLAEIERRALANGVPGLRRVTRTGIGEIEPYVRGVAALYSPHTASVDFTGMCQALAGEIRAAGGAVRLGTPIRSVGQDDRGVTVRSGAQAWTFDQLIVCAGLTGDQLAAQLGGLADMRIVPFRGEYYELRPAVRHRVRGMVYPVPNPRYPFLGVHLTRDVDGGVHVGPNAVLALALEGYRWRDVGLRDLRDIGSWPGTWRLVGQHWRNGLKEMAGLPGQTEVPGQRTGLPAGHGARRSRQVHGGGPGAGGPAGRQPRRRFRPAVGGPGHARPQRAVAGRDLQPRHRRTHRVRPERKGRRRVGASSRRGRTAAHRDRIAPPSTGIASPLR